MEDEKYDYLVELIQAVFGVKSIGISTKAENMLYDKGKLCDKNRFNADSVMKLKKVFEIAFTEGSKFIHNYKMSNYEYEETISQFKIADSINIFILKSHGIDIKKTYSFHRNINYDIGFVKVIKEILFCLMHEVYKLNNDDNENKICNELGFVVFEYIMEKMIYVNDNVRFYGDIDKIRPYIVRYDFKKNLLLIYGKIIIDWGNNSVVDAVHEAMYSFEQCEDGNGYSNEVTEENIREQLKIYNEIRTDDSRNLSESLKKIVYLCSQIAPFEYYGRYFLISSQAKHLKTRKDFLREIFERVYERKNISIVSYYPESEDRYFLTNQNSSFKNCKFTNIYIDKFVEIFKIPLVNSEIELKTANTKRDSDNLYNSCDTFTSGIVLEKLNEFFGNYGLNIIGNVSENQELIMLNILTYVVAPEIFNVTILSDDESKTNINTISLFKKIADFLINGFNIYPFISDEYYFRYRYYSIYRYINDDKLFYAAAKAVENDYKGIKGVWDFKDYEKMGKLIFKGKLYKNELNSIYKKLCEYVFRWDMISHTVRKLKKKFFDDYNKDCEDYDMSLILLKIILLCENFAPSDVNEYVEVENCGLPDDRLIEAVHKYADKFKEDNE